MDKEKKQTLDELISSPEETEAEKKNPDTLDLDEPKRHIWLRVLVWTVIICIIGGVAYTAYLVYRGNQNFSAEEKIEGTVGGKIDLDSGNKTEATPTVVYVNSSDGLNMRTEPSSTSKILMVVPDKAKLDVIKLDDGWYQVNYSGQSGYVWNEFVTKALPPAN